MDVHAAVADPTRRRILGLLAEGDCAAGDLAGAFPVSRPAISRHLRVLRESGLVQSRVEAQQRIYSLRAAPLEEIDEWLEPYRRFWANRLDALETEIRRGRREGTTT